jgi:hypothetical protein
MSRGAKQAGHHELAQMLRMHAENEITAVEPACAPTR